MLRILGWLLLIIVIAGAVIIVRILNAAGTFTEVKPHFAGKCQTTEGVVGAEDIELDRATGFLFISSQDRRPSADKSYKPGALYLAHIDHPEVPPQPLAVGDKVPVLHPHGISLFSDMPPSDGLTLTPKLSSRRTTLAVVNHTDEGDEVLFFDVKVSSPDPISRTPGGVPEAPAPTATLTFHHKVKDPLMHSLNDVTLVGHEAFYATNDHGSETEFGKFLETWLLLPRANVVYFDGADAAIAAGGFNYANGINRSANLSEIYVAEATGRALQTFRRDMTGALEHIHTLHLDAGPDNLDVDSDGAIWIGAHPRLLDFLAHVEDKTKLSPSAVLKVTPAGDDTKFETIYVNMGEELSGSSIAIHHKNRLVIGPVLDPKFLNCSLN